MWYPSRFTSFSVTFAQVDLAHRGPSENRSRNLLYRLRDLNGELVAPKDRAETVATYLEQKHWNNPSEHTMPRSDALQRLQDQFNVGQFTLLEFDQARTETFSSIALIIGGVTSRRPKAFFVLGLCQSLRRVTRIFPKTTALSLC